MWKFWTFLSDDEVKECEERALSCHNMTKKDGILIPNAFPLAMFDHHKCTTTAIMLHAKQDMMTCNPRDKKYSTTFWNCQRPYIRCSCVQDAASGCKGNMLWFDHAIWFIINNLDRFFDDNYPTLATKLGAFITWMSTAAREGVKMQITFAAVRKMMEDAALEYTVTPEARLLAKYYEAPRARKVERFIKPVVFSLATMPNPSPTANKRRKINVNAIDYSRNTVQPQMRNANVSKFSRGSSFPRQGRGGYNRNFKSPRGD
jgi:hypothetical protein